MEFARLEPGTRPYLEIEFPPPPPGRPFLYANMVASIDGKAVIDDTEAGLGSDDDKRRMQELRAHADAVLNGASTLRASGSSSRVRDPELVAWRLARGLREQPLGLLITTAGDFEPRGPYFEPGPKHLDAVVIATDMPAARRAEIEALGPEVLDAAPGPDGLREAFGELRSRYNLTRVLCEGGPTLLHAVVEAGLLDELFLTVSPLIVGGRDTITIVEGAEPFGRGHLPRFEPLSAIVNEEAGELYLRYRHSG